jgi:hypothetical protein
MKNTTREHTQIKNTLEDLLQFFFFDRQQEIKITVVYSIYMLME